MKAWPSWRIGSPTSGPLKWLSVWAFRITLFGATGSVHATVITYEAEQINTAKNVWEYSYTVNNDTAETIEEFLISFDIGLYKNLRRPSTPANWDSFIAQPDSALPSNGFYDAYALPGAGIDPGQSLSGFKLRFKFLGVDTPGAQRFSILDPDNGFAEVDNGFTQLAGATPPAPVAEPATLLLSLVGLAMLAGSWRHRAVATTT